MSEQWRGECEKMRRRYKENGRQGTREEGKRKPEKPKVEPETMNLEPGTTN